MKDVKHHCFYTRSINLLLIILLATTLTLSGCLIDRSPESSQLPSQTETETTPSTKTERPSETSAEPTPEPTPEPTVLALPMKHL